MQEVRVPIADLAEGELALDEETGHYVARVLRLRRGDRFVAFDVARRLEAEGTVEHVDQGAVTVRVGVPREARVAATEEVAWIQGIAKGDKCDAIVRDVTELGATLFVAAATERAVVKLD